MPVTKSNRWFCNLLSAVAAVGLATGLLTAAAFAEEKPTEKAAAAPAESAPAAAAAPTEKAPAAPAETAPAAPAEKRPFLATLPELPLTIAQRGKDFRYVTPSPVAGVPTEKRKVWVLVLDGMVEPDMAAWIKTETNAAIADGATHIVYQIDTYGGLALSAIEIIDFLSREAGRKVHTIAYVPDKAISAGAMMSLACRDIIVGEQAKIGASAPVAAGVGGSSQIGDTEREKLESVLRSHLRVLAQAHGWPAPLCEAMITPPDSAIYRIRNRRGDRFEYHHEKDIPTDAAVYDLGSKRRIVAAGELLTLAGREAFDYGFADAVVPDIKGVLAHYGVRGEPAVTHKIPERPDFLETQAVKSLNSPFTAGLILAAALVFLALGLKTGEPQLLIIGLAATAMFFWAKHASGDAEGWEIALVVLGLALLAVELLFLPTMGGLAVAGGGLVLLGLVLCFVPPISLSDLMPSPAESTPDEPLPSLAAARQTLIWRELAEAAGVVLASLVAVSIALPVILSNLHRIPYFGRVILTETQSGHAGPALVPGAEKGLGSDGEPVRLGTRGRSETALRPVGKARFGDRLLDVVADGAFLETGALVEVISADGNRILVRQVA